MAEAVNIPLIKEDEYRYRIPKESVKGMRVDGRIYIDETLLKNVEHDQCLQQVVNVATLPGIVKYSLAMPDIHWGYGFPIGGVAATDVENGGVVSPGGVGFDINCGVRLVRSELEVDKIKDKIADLTRALFRNIPCGVGKGGDIHLSSSEEKGVMRKGAGWMIEHGYGQPEDLPFMEEEGCFKETDPSEISARAVERGSKQLGTLGSGNHFLELQEVCDIYDESTANVFGIFKGQLVVMIHSGSRGFGYQVCDDALRKLITTPSKYGISLPDRQLVCAPVRSPEGQEYLNNMRCAINYAFANRQGLMHRTRETIERFFQMSPRDLGLKLVYDVAHNIAKLEKHVVDGKEKLLCVHRKGATRSYPKGSPHIPEAYRQVGQPVIIPGDMGRYSYLCVGTEKAMEESFGTTCHGAGRVLSRTKAKKLGKGRDLIKEYAAMGITVCARGKWEIWEEASHAYKDVNQVVNVCHKAGLAKKVARMRPLGVVKG